MIHDSDALKTIYLKLQQKVAVFKFYWEFFLYQASNNFCAEGGFYISFFIFFVFVYLFYPRLYQVSAQCVNCA